MPDSTATNTPTAPASPAETRPPADSNEWRKIAGRIISIVLVLVTCVLVLVVWDIIEHHPRTDDAIAEANVIGIAPRVSGPIIKLNIEDNQEVKTGDLLYEIDPADFELAVDNAQAALVSLDRQIEIARAADQNLKYQIKAAEAGVELAQAQVKQTGDTWRRLLPLLPKGFTTTDDVERAETSFRIASATLASDEQQLNQAKTTVSTLESLKAQRPGAMASLNIAKLNLSYCKVVAPFPAKILNLNLSVGAFATAGVPFFSMLDLRHWYVIANFREGELRHFTTNSLVDVYLMSAPQRHFVGRVQGIGWGVQSTDEIDISTGVPSVPRELNWVHIAQRFPVRIEVENADPELFRKGASAVVIIK